MKIATIKTVADKKAHVITRSGKRKDQGGAGVMWRCSCKNGRKCERMQALFKSVLPSYDVKLTRAGERFYTYAVATAPAIVYIKRRTGAFQAAPSST